MIDAEVTPGEPAVTPVLRLSNVTKTFEVGGKLFGRGKRALRAVDGVTFDIPAQRTFSLVGESGCGKTTTARLVLDLERPTGGEVLFEGTGIPQLAGNARRRYRASVQAVFQDPTSALNPRRRVGDIVAEPLIVTGGLRGRELDARVVELLRAVGLSTTTRSNFPHELSGGMRQRVAVAQALALNPALIVLDEPVSALDVSIRAQVMNLLKRLQRQFSIAYLLIAHDLATVRFLSHDVGAMYLGRLVEHAPASSFFDLPLHPYSVALISAAEPRRPGEASQAILLGGDVPSPLDPPPGCPFHTRCWLHRALPDAAPCETEVPALRELVPGHRVACHLAERLLDPQQRVVHITEAAGRSHTDLLAVPPVDDAAADGDDAAESDDLTIQPVQPPDLSELEASCPLPGEA